MTVDLPTNVAADVTLEVIAIISKQKNVPAEELGPHTRLADLGVDSLDVIEIAFALEQKFDISMTLDRHKSTAEAFETIEQVAGSVNVLIADKVA
jgi:acyl carrier protein